MRLALHLAALCLIGVGVGCKVDIDFNNTRFQCTDGNCPDGYRCVEAVCVLENDAAPGEIADGGGGAADAAGELQTCDIQFSAANGYVLCAENADSCEFFNATGDGTQVLCTTVCETYGATCVESYDATAGETPCTRDTGAEACAVLHSSQICVCTRSPAST